MPMTHVTAHRYPVAIVIGFMCSLQAVELPPAHGAAIELWNRFTDDAPPPAGVLGGFAQRAADLRFPDLHLIPPDLASLNPHEHAAPPPRPTRLVGVSDMYDAGRLPPTGTPSEGLPVANPPIFHLVDDMTLRTPLHRLKPVAHPVFNVPSSVGRIIEHLIAPPEHLLFDEPLLSLDACRRTADAEHQERSTLASVPLPGTFALFAACLVVLPLVRTETRMRITPA